MSRLCLLRHAKAAAPVEDGADRDRPLAPRGQRDLAGIASWLREHRFAPDLVLCSDAVRTRQTVALVLSRLGGRPEMLYEDGLYLAEADALLARLRDVPEERTSVLLVGHNPGLHALAVMLAAGAPRLRHGLPTAALAWFELAGSWATLGPAQARLAYFVTPGTLGGTLGSG